MFTTTRPSYSRSVFINCPFDDEYVPIFQTSIFTLLILNFTPRSAFEIDDGGVRLDKILTIIGECKFGIHDICRTQLNDDLPRFNMPFELGLDMGCKSFSDQVRHRKKILLIVDVEKHRFRKYLSDISGQDIKGHDNDPLKMIRLIRDWLRPSGSHLPSASFIEKEYLVFQKQVKRICEQLNLDHDDHGFVDYCYLVRTWLEERKGMA
ncbi:MAG TPA: hypothetical protein VK612_01605 [Pyrinomonadaceae bacterium]|nr:hypothetical protein [Pyrinomonadaceae bacterium]